MTKMIIPKQFDGKVKFDSWVISRRSIKVDEPKEPKETKKIKRPKKAMIEVDIHHQIRKLFEEYKGKD